MLNLWTLLEYVDGTVARCTNTSSLYGEFIDDLNGYLISGLCFIAAGMGAYSYSYCYLSSLNQWWLASNIDRSIFLLLGGWASCFLVLSRLVGARFTLVFSKDQSDILGKTRSAAFRRPYLIAWANLNNPTGAIFPLMLLAVGFGLLDVFVLLWALITTTAFIASAVIMMRNARSTYG